MRARLRAATADLHARLPKARLPGAGAVSLAALLAALLAASLALSGRPPESNALETGFRNPPAAARMRCYWWWLNGHTTPATITRDLEEMKAKGYGGALLVDADGSGQNGNRQVAPGPTFGSPAWRELYLHAIREADRLGLEITLNVQSGWNMGGPMVTAERSPKLLTWSRVSVEGPAAVSRDLPAPPVREGFYRDIAVLAYPLRHGASLAGQDNQRRPIRQLAIKIASQEAGFSMPASMPLLEDVPAEPGEEDAAVREVRDLSKSMAADGRLVWQAPAGAWEILRIGYTSSGARVSTSSGAWQGLAIDYLDRGAFEWFWRENIQPLLEDARPYLGRSLRYLCTDSWELGGMNWTTDFRDQFRRLRGYDPLPYLPIVAGRILDTRETSNRFLNDLRRTVGDLVISRHYAVFAELAARFGLGIHPESGGPHGAPIDALETLGVSAIPQTEFWARSPTHRSTDADRFFVKEASSAAHIYGRPLVAAEGMTSIGPQWEESIWNDLKPTFDQAVTEGLNRLVWHTFTSSPSEAGLPGQEYFAGTHLNPNVTWWREAGAFIGYLNRVQFMMQQGQPVSDVLYYYGDQVPNFAQLKSSDPAKVLPGYDYDTVDEQVLVNRLSVRGGRLVLPGGTSYRLLVLPARESISLAALHAIRKLVNEGAAVVGPMPRRLTGLPAAGQDGDSEVRAIASELWSSRKIQASPSGRSALAGLGVQPDFEFTGGVLDYVHRRLGDGSQVYFVRNTQPDPVRSEVVLRVGGLAPELWHPDSGAIEPASVYQALGSSRTLMPLWLEPNGSVFVVFRKPAARHAVAVSPAETETRLNLESGELSAETAGRYRVQFSDGSRATADVPAIPQPLAVAGPWRVEFTPGWGAPANVTFDRLESWTENANPGIRYYSGTAKYSARVELPAGDQWLDLGEVREIARVRWNGRDLGVLWKKPFRIALGSAAKAGWNDVEVEVTNLWPNRLIGDQRLPLSERRTSTNITKWTADSPLMPSGLLGPVTVRMSRTVKLVAEPSTAR